MYGIYFTNVNQLVITIKIDFTLVKVLSKSIFTNVNLISPFFILTLGKKLLEFTMFYYTIPQAAKMLGRTRQDVWYLVKNNKIKSFKIGRLYVITQEELGNYMLNKLSGSSSDQVNEQSNNSTDQTQGSIQ